jgi:predicted nucleotidyltransferase
VDTSPTYDQLRIAFGRALASTNGLASVVVHGSAVRGDFWRGQSDVDVMIVGQGSTIPASIDAPNLRWLASLFGAEIEAQYCSTIDLDAQRAAPIQARWVQFGLHGFDTVANHWTVFGRDLLLDFPVPVGDGLRTVACTRLRSLCWVESRRYPSEIWKWACEALKAAQIYFAVSNNRPPTRDKRLVRDNFFDLVPGFEGRDFATVIWDHYCHGRRPTDALYQANCVAFIERLCAIVDSLESLRG